MKGLKRFATKMRSTTHNNRLNKLIILVCVSNFILARQPTILLLEKTPERSSLVSYKFCNIRIDTVLVSE